ncbi:MAG: hypothetical protein PHC64_02545 [Candidatus Gastranaerophilales bacterium]|nr:hypothetical protein [Candidatus Gastranaerophilales bacterium]
MMTGSVGRLSANNAAYNWMSAANCRTRLCSFTGNPSGALQSDKYLTSQMLNDSLTYKAGLLQEESLKKLSDENIKRSFSTFA